MEDMTPDWEKNVVWYPGEPIYGKRPYGKIQKIQVRINRLFQKGKIKHPKRYFTGAILMKLKVIKGGIKGLNPEKT